MESSSTDTRATQISADADIAPAAAMFAEPTRARILGALADGRALPAGTLASEAGVSAQTASTQLARLREAGLVAVQPQGRRRYYRLAGPHVAAAVEALARLAAPRPVRSLREGTRAEALRYARTCYDHLAGRLGVAVTTALVERGALVRDDGVRAPRRRDTDGFAVPVRDHPYRLGRDAAAVCADFGVDLDALRAAPARRPLLRFCVDWTEQRHHVAGRLGAAFATTLTESGWLAPARVPRALRVTELGARELTRLGCLPEPPQRPGAGG
jgi:DNA-binding transcriptional ArsR family regulator